MKRLAATVFLGAIVMSGCKSTGGAESAGDKPPTQPVTVVPPADPVAASPSDADVAPSTAPAAATPLDAAKARCVAAVQAENAQAIPETDVLDGPGQIKIVRARDPKAYPGTGVCALVFDPTDGKTYGKRGEHSIASLMQARGWLAGDTRLPDADLIKLVHQARFDGLIILKGESVKAGADGAVQILLPQLSMQGDLQRTWIVNVPPSGDETVTAQKP